MDPNYPVEVVWMRVRWPGNIMRPVCDDELTTGIQCVRAAAWAMAGTALGWTVQELQVTDQDEFGQGSLGDLIAHVKFADAPAGGIRRATMILAGGFAALDYLKRADQHYLANLRAVGASNVQDEQTALAALGERPQDYAEARTAAEGLVRAHHSVVLAAAHALAAANGLLSKGDLELARALAPLSRTRPPDQPPPV